MSRSSRRRGKGARTPRCGRRLVAWLTTRWGKARRRAPAESARGRCREPVANEDEDAEAAERITLPSSSGSNSRGGEAGEAASLEAAVSMALTGGSPRSEPSLASPSRNVPCAHTQTDLGSGDWSARK